MNSRTVCFVVSACLLCGCATTVVDVKQAPAAENCQMNGGMAVQGSNLQADGEKWSVQEVSGLATSFRVSVGAQGPETAFGQEVAGIVSGRLGSAGAVVLTEKSGDFQLKITPSFKTVDVSGELYRVDCQVAVELQSCQDGRVYDSMRFNYPSPRRQIGLAAAKAQFRDKAVQDCLAWAVKALDTVASRKLAVAYVRFNYPRKVTLDANWKAKKVERLGSELMKVQGILGYELFQDEKDSRDCVFRILYRQGAFPAGVANTIASKVTLDR